MIFFIVFIFIIDGYFIIGSEILVGDSLFIYLYKIDQQGNVVWEKIYFCFSYWDEVLFFYVVDIMLLSSGGYIVIGSNILMFGLQFFYII